MLYVWVHGCDPGRVSDGSRLAIYQTISIECPCLLVYFVYFWDVCFVNAPSFFVVLVFCCRCSFVNVPLIFSCRADHVPDWQPRILLGKVEARSVNVKKTTTTEPELVLPLSQYFCLHVGGAYFPFPRLF